MPPTSLNGRAPVWFGAGTWLLIEIDSCVVPCRDTLYERISVARTIRGRFTGANARFHFALKTVPGLFKLTKEHTHQIVGGAVRCRIALMCPVMDWSGSVVSDLALCL
jgi:hypothetical protein